MSIIFTNGDGENHLDQGSGGGMGHGSALVQRDGSGASLFLRG